MSSASDRKSLPSIGFLTVAEYGEHGLLGGYLLLNPSGRPLEFHCTAPVKPNRAQKILYGPTLEPFLYGEQIGQTLIQKAKNQPLLVCTNVESVLAVRDFCSLPVVLVTDEAAQQPRAAEESDSNAPIVQRRFDAPQNGLPAPNSALLRFSLARRQVAVLQKYEQDQNLALEHWTKCDAEIDLLEPFGRIEQAIEEARRGAK